MARRSANLPAVQYDRVVLRGGWDLITPTYELTPGRVRNVENFEVQTREGYARIDGYERFDGQPKPSDATYTILQFDSFVETPRVGETLTGATSGATGEVVAVDGGNTLVAVTKISGAFSVGETVNGPNATTIVAVSSNGTNRVMTSFNGTSWTPVLISEDHNWQAVTRAPSLGLFVAVAGAGTNRVMTSSDGATWSHIVSAVADTGTWVGIEWSPSLSLLVAVALNGKVMTSSDGTAWTLATAVEEDWLDVVWAPSLGLFAAVGRTGTNRIITSSNGTVWTARAAPEANIWSGVTWAPSLNLFVAVANTGTNRVMTSSNGIAWASVADAVADVGFWISVTWSPSLSLFVAVSSSGTAAMTSSNGTVWAAASAPAGFWLDVTWVSSLSLFVAVGLTGANRAITSSDGSTWAAHATESNTWQGVVGKEAFFSGTLVAPDTAISAETDAQYLNFAADVRRSDILVVPGSGPVRGVLAMAIDGEDEVFAFRDDSAGTEVDLYKASPAGWVQVPFDNEISFTSGAVAIPTDGDLLTGGVSGATATVLRVMLETNDWSGSGTGRLIIGTVAGGPFQVETATLGASATLTLAGPETAISMVPGGHFEFDIANFAGQLETLRAYGCDGANRGFEFDGTTFAPIEIDPAKPKVLKPKHVAEHKNHLFFSIDSSVFNSGVGLPFKFATADGAAEQPLGDTVTGFKVQPGAQTTATLAIGARNTMYMLYGTSALDWNMVKFISFTGALDYTMETLTETFMLDDRGILGLTSSERFGNFAEATLTHEIQPFIDSHRGLVTTSYLRRERDQYRILFSDGTGLYLTIPNGQFVGAMPVRYADTMFCAFNGELANGDEVNFLGGSSSGFVYEADKGTSFDGEDINGFLHLIWNPQGSPRLIKQYRHASLETKAQGFVEVGFTYEIGYGITTFVQPISAARRYTFIAQGDNDWTLTGLWGQGVWGGRALGEIDMEIAASGQNVMANIDAGTDYIPSFALNSLTLHYSVRRGLR